MTVNWDVKAPGVFDSEPLVCPANFNFPPGGTYRLKLSNIPGRPGLEFYPTLEVASTVPRTEAYLAHYAIPFAFTPEDFDQVTSGNFVAKVLYLPDPAFQELALAGVETLVSTALEPGVDPIVEANRRGAILAIMRLGNRTCRPPGGRNRDNTRRSPPPRPKSPCRAWRRRENGVVQGSGPVWREVRDRNPKRKRVRNRNPKRKRGRLVAESLAYASGYNRPTCCPPLLRFGLQLWQ